MKKLLVFRLSILFIVAFAFTLVPLNSFGQNSREARETALKEQISNLIASKDFTIIANMAMPQSGSNRSLDGSYDIQIKRDSVLCHLPYIGRAYSVPYGGGEGLVFDAPIESYSQEVTKKGVTKISFTARSKEDRYQIYLDISDSGLSSIRVMPNNKQSISFSGEIDTRE